MATLTPTTRVKLSGSMQDASGLSVPWDPAILTAITMGGGQIAFTTIAGGTTAKIHSKNTPAGQISIVLVPLVFQNTVQAQNVNVGGGATDVGIPIPPGGWYAWMHPTSDSDVFIVNAGSAAMTVGYATF